MWWIWRQDGKAPAGVAARARRAGVPVIAPVGRCQLNRDQLREVGIRAIYPLSDLEPDPNRSMADAARLLTAIGRRIAHSAARSPNSRPSS
jgi:glycerate kinase